MATTEIAHKRGALLLYCFDTNDTMILSFLMSCYCKRSGIIACIGRATQMNLLGATIQCYMTA